MNLSFFRREISQNQFNYFEILVILVFAILPLFANFPYRVNIFLSWDGAYRMSEGHIPFKDFGLPMGYGYWVIPSIFFKIFGPKMITLIKAQAFINIVSGLAFRSILSAFGLKSGLRWLGVVLFVISYSFFNFWPWYNQTVIVYELIGLAFLLNFLFRKENNVINYLSLAGATFFLFLSLFTKQDGGGLALLLSGALVLYHCIASNRYLDLAFFIGSYVLWALFFIVPLLPFEFGYWFNYGQEPHNSRISLFDFVDVFLAESKWEKFYLMAILGHFFFRLGDAKKFFFDKKAFMFFLFTLGILVQAILFQVTSYTPPNNNIFFHSFCAIYLASLIPFAKQAKTAFNLLPLGILILLWWSPNFWKYARRTVERFIPKTEQSDDSAISRNNFTRNKSDTVAVGMSAWTHSNLEVFDKIYMPESTVHGINRLMSMPILKKDNLKFLNMTELTPLAHEIGYEIEKGRPLWYHKGVGIFEPQIDEYVAEIERGKYDIVLFEWAPTLNNFYPDDIRKALYKEYDLVDQFLAPRNPSDAQIEVFVRRLQ